MPSQCSPARIAILSIVFLCSVRASADTFEQFNGKIIAAQGNQLQFQEDGKNSPVILSLVQETVLRLYAPMSMEYIESGVVGEVQGIYDVKDDLIKNGEFFVYFTPYDRNVALGKRNENAVYDYKIIVNDPNRLPVRFYATVTEMNPGEWTIKGINRAHQSQYVVAKEGEDFKDKPTQYLQTFGREFKIDPNLLEIEGQQYVQVRLPINWRIDPSLMPRADGTYYPSTGKVRTLNIFFDQPIEPENVGVKTKKKRSATRSNKVNKRSKTRSSED